MEANKEKDKKYQTKIDKLKFKKFYEYIISIGESVLHDYDEWAKKFNYTKECLELCACGLIEEKELDIDLSFNLSSNILNNFKELLEEFYTLLCEK